MSLLLALSILGAVVGMPLTRHICHMSETLTVNIGAEEHSCEEPATPSCDADGKSVLQAEETCCHFSVTHEKADLLSLLKTEGKLLIGQALMPVAIFSFAAQKTCFKQFKEAIPLASDSSPPLAGRDLLAFISILRI